MSNQTMMDDYERRIAENRRVLNRPAKRAESQPRTITAPVASSRTPMPPPPPVDPVMERAESDWLSMSSNQRRAIAGGDFAKFVERRRVEMKYQADDRLTTHTHTKSYPATSGKR